MIQSILWSETQVNNCFSKLLSISHARWERRNSWKSLSSTLVTLQSIKFISFICIYLISQFFIQVCNKIQSHNALWYLEFQIRWINRDGDFADFSAFANFFLSASNLPHFCGFPHFPNSNQRERNAEKKYLQNNPNRASERNAEKLLTKNIPYSYRASAPWTSEQWASCAVHTFILLTSGVLNGNNLVWGMHFLHRCYFLLEVAR